MTDMTVCSVCIENTAYSFDKLFDYAVPAALVQQARPGVRVLVPFGRGNKLRQSMVMRIKQEGANTLKYINSVLDPEPVVTQEMLALAVFMKERYFCTYYDCIKAMLPAGINYKISVLYSVCDCTEAALVQLPADEAQTVTYLLKAKKPVKQETILEALGFSDNKILEALTEKGILRKTEDAFRRISDATTKMVTLQTGYESLHVKTTPKQNKVIELLQQFGSASVKEISYFTGVTSVVVDNLVKSGVAFYFQEEKFRTPKQAEAEKQKREITLTREQQQAFAGLYQKYREDKPGVSLLYGITGSGKTSVFMKLIEKVRQDGRGVILMVPEIALTPQLVAMFSAVYGSDVAIFHSGLSLGERLDEYKRVKKGLAKVVIGTRSAVFAPLEAPGLIILDEEQESTYKSENTPRYHAREVAKFRCTQNNGLLLLSSATPDVETYHHAVTGRYSVHMLKNRFGGAVLPKVIVADMNQELQNGNTTGFSSELLAGVEQNLEEGRQSILLLNRRGHNTFVTCKNCKEPLTCPNCSISLTYHSANNRLLCHYCGHSVRYTNQCPLCHTEGLQFGGAGTQRAEQELFELFPGARILRLDTDATMTKFSHEKKLSAFANGEYDILVGTQMVAKGLDFPNVTLVGVINADQMLYSDDYRSYERAFSLLTQVVGRSGRGREKGRAVIQTYTPENPVISMAARQDYDTFFKSEIAIRKAMLYPPFADICLTGFVGQDHTKTMRGARQFMEMLVKTAKEKYSGIPLRVLGPSAALVSKVNNKYRYQIIIKCRNDKRFREMLSTLLSEFSSIREFGTVTAYVDMNPLYF